MENQFLTQKIDKLKTLIDRVSALENKESVFDLICQISFELESYIEDDLKDLRSCNLHVELIWKVFHCDLFLNNLKILFDTEYFDQEKVFEEKEIVQLLLRLSFFLVSVLIPVLSEDTIFFLNQQLNRSIKNIHKSFFEKQELSNLFFLLEDINYNVKYRFEKRTLVVLNTNFLNMNQISSRIFVGSLLIYNFGYSVLPNLITSVVKREKKPEKLFRYVWNISKKIKGYQNYEVILRDKYFTKRRKDGIKSFLLLLKDQNIENLLFLVNEMSVNYKSYQESIDQKIEYASKIKDKVQNRFEELSVFKNDNRQKGDWSNKIFLNTIRFLSVLESIKDAENNEWKRKTFSFFLNKWLNDLYDIISFYDTERNNKIIIYVEGYSDKIILENAYDKLHPKHNNFVFYDTGGKLELFKKIDAVQIADLGETSFGVFDFDEAFNDFNGLRKGKNNFGEIKGLENECCFRYRESCKNKIFALLLPVPKTRNLIASLELKEKSRLSVEMLFDDAILKKNNNLGVKKVLGGGSIPIFCGDKIKFAEKTKDLNQDDFNNFRPLFNKLFELIKLS